MPREEKVLVSARFDPKLPYYWMVSTIWVLAITCIGIPIIPIWLLIGWRIHQRQFERLECDLTERTLNIRRGLWFRVEKNVPLDKIQDVAMKEGPILRHLGLSALFIETAGQSNPQGHGDATLAGVVDAPAFRDAILDQRERVVTSADGGATQGSEPEVLEQIRDSLLRIESHLEKRSSGSEG